MLQVVMQQIMTLAKRLQVPSTAVPGQTTASFDSPYVPWPKWLWSAKDFHDNIGSHPIDHPLLLVAPCLFMQIAPLSVTERDDHLTLGATAALEPALGAAKPNHIEQLPPVDG